jgi:hypothetical protein
MQLTNGPVARVLRGMSVPGASGALGRTDLALPDEVPARDEVVQDVAHGRAGHRHVHLAARERQPTRASVRRTSCHGIRGASRMLSMLSA